MALGRFGIKEVADVRFYEVVSDLSASAAVEAVKTAKAVISFDTLKVSTIESTAENSEARGGKGNAALISWDYGREITVNIEDALMSMDCLALLFGDSNSDTITVNANKFPGTYTVVGKTFARDEATGKDHLFTFVIPKAKIQSETTLTMEAEGDPTVIGMTLKVLRCKNGDMMELIADNEVYNSDNIWANADAGLQDQTAPKVSVQLVATDGTVASYVLTVGEDWPDTIDPANYDGMPAKVAGGTYYAKA